MGELVTPAGRRAGETTGAPVYSVTKHAGFVPSLEYFNKQVFSRDLVSYKLVEPGDFAYATIHLDEGSIGIAPERALISPMYTVFRPMTAEVEPDYLIRFLKSPRALAQYELMGTGAIHRRKAISLTALGHLEVPLPPLPEQRRIAAILDHADALRAKRRQVLDHLDALIQSIFHDMFGRSRDTILAARLMPFMRNGVSPSTAGNHAAQVLTLSAVTQGRFDPNHVKHGVFATKPGDDKRVTTQDFLMCRGNGNRRLVGVGTFSPNARSDLVFPDTVIAGRIDPGLVTMEFLAAAWRQRSVRSQIESVARTTNGTYKVNQQTLGAVQVPIARLPDQHEFSRRVQPVDIQRAAAERSQLAVNALFASLQSRAFRGEL